MAAAVERLDFRLASENKKLIEQAAAMTGQSVTDFAVSTLTHRARKVLRNEQSLVLSDRDRDLFLNALDSPPAPNSKLKRAAARYKAARKSGALR